MDEITKYRVVGAAIWLLLLIIIVPAWYNNPVEDWHNQVWQTPVTFSDELEMLEPAPPALEKPPVKPVEQAAQVAKPPAPAKPVVQKTEQPAQEQQPAPKPESKPEAKSVPKPEPKPAPEQKPVAKPASKQEAWQVRVATYSSIKTANNTLGMLEQRYEVTIGDFSNGDKQMFTVRVGPYATEAEAQKVKQDLDKELNTNSVIVKIR